MDFPLSPAPTAARLHALALATLLACALPTPAQPNPASAVQMYDLPTQSLGSALARIASQSGQQISVPAELVRGLQAPGVRGSLSAEQAARAALAGSGLELVRTDTGNWGLRKTSPPAVAASANDAALPTITISGKAPGSTTEGTGSYTTFSTSSSTRLNLTPQETPQPITVITRQRIEDQGLQDLIDVLEATSGVTVKAFSVGADAPQIWARGATITNFQIDGIPSATSMSNYVQSSVMFDRVEVVKGATGMMSGLGTPSATINMIRKRPTQEPLTSVSAEAGTWSRYGAGLDISRALNADASVRGRLIADYKRQGAWTDNYRQDHGVLYGIGEVDLGPRTLLSAGFSHTTRQANAPLRVSFIKYGNGLTTGLGPSSMVTPSYAYYDHQHDSVFGSVEHTFGSGWSAKAELTHARYEYDSLVPSMSTPSTPTSGGTVYNNHWANQAEQTSLDAYLTGPFSLFGRRHEMIGGITLSVLDQQSPSYTQVRQNVASLFTWTQEAVAPVTPQTGETASKEYQHGAYLSSRLQLSDAASLLVGGRLTNWKRDRQVLSWATNASTNTRTREKNVVIPYAGLVYALNDTYSLYASYTKIFRPQDAGTLMYTPTGTMDPEEGVSYEAGIKASFQEGALTSSLSVFRTKQDNLAVWNSARYMYEAISNATTEGVELELNGQLATGWQLSAGYVYNETRNKDDQRILPRIPRNTVKLFTTYRLPGDWNALTLGGGIHWESKTGDPLTAYTQNSHALVNLMARYEVNPQLALTAHLNNALDKRYYTALAGTTGSYGAPRNLMVSMKYSF